MTKATIKNIIRKLIAGEDYYSEALDAIDADFLQYIVDFFKRIVKAKLDKKLVTSDWYREEFLISHSLSNTEMNTISVSNSDQIALDTTLKHYDALYDVFNNLGMEDMGTTFTVKFNGVSFSLNLNESLILFNTLAVRRSSLQNRLWSETRKQVEKPLMIALCALFKVPKKYYDQRNLPESQRESDFYLFDDTGKDYPGEVKLMGKGNPESADAVYARDSRFLVANKLSDTNKQQMDSEGILWVELQTENGYKRFEEVLKTLSIPYEPFTGDLQSTLDKILPVILSDDVQDSVTPEVVLSESEQRNESGSELLVEF
ncbi:MAG: CfrBI family restriction endonuclease [Candidatus Poribacteria bacterium]|nr:CfrBI family restriction endonuclease [Candidatus Poribacteria bacterium]